VCLRVCVLTYMHLSVCQFVCVCDGRDVAGCLCMVCISAELVVGVYFVSIWGLQVCCGKGWERFLP